MSVRKRGEKFVATVWDADADILAAARAAGLKVPDWYVGRRASPPPKLESGLGKVVADVLASRDSESQGRSIS